MMEDGDNLFQCMSRMLAENIDPTRQEDLIWERYGESVALLVLDSSGFSRTCQSHGIIHFLSRLMQLREVCDSVMKSHHCKRLHFEADNAFAVFGRPADAIAAALASQEAVYRAGLMLNDSERFRVSAGVGYGRVLYSETLEGYFGDEMNIASKLGEDIASGDEVLVSEAAFREAAIDRADRFSACSTDISGVTLQYYRYCFTPPCRAVESA